MVYLVVNVKSNTDVIQMLSYIAEKNIPYQIGTTIGELKDFDSDAPDETDDVEGQPVENLPEETVEDKVEKLFKAPEQKVIDVDEAGKSPSPKPKKRRVRQPVENINCKNCGISVHPRTNLLYRHASQHLFDRRYQCAYCKCVFRTIEKARGHAHSIHLHLERKTPIDLLTNAEHLRLAKYTWIIFGLPKLKELADLAEKKYAPEEQISESSSNEDESAGSSRSGDDCASDEDNDCASDEEFSDD